MGVLWLVGCLISDPSVFTRWPVMRQAGWLKSNDNCFWRGVVLSRAISIIGHNKTYTAQGSLGELSSRPPCVAASQLKPGPAWQQHSITIKLKLKARTRQDRMALLSSLARLTHSHTVVLDMNVAWYWTMFCLFWILKYFVILWKIFHVENLRDVFITTQV